MCGELLRKTGLHVVYHRHSVVPSQQDGGKSGLFDRVNAGVCTAAKAGNQSQRERDVEQELPGGKAYRNALESQRICRPDQADAGYLDVAAYRVSEEIDGISELAQPLHHLADGDRRPPVLIK